MKLTLLDEVREAPIPEVVAIARGVLADALSGKLRAVVVVMVTSNGERQMARYIEPEHLPQTYWGLSMVAQEMVTHGIEESEHGDVLDMGGEE